MCAALSSGCLHFWINLELVKNLELPVRSFVEERAAYVSQKCLVGIVVGDSVRRGPVERLIHGRLVGGLSRIGRLDIFHSVKTVIGY